MPSRIQIRRSLTSGNRPASASLAPGALYVNIPDRVIGFMDDVGDPVDLTSVANFSEDADYDAGAFVVHSGQLLRAIGSITAGSFTATEWQRVDGAPATVDGTAPSSPQTDDLWVDTSASPPSLRYYNGSAWIAVGERQSGVSFPAFSAASTYQSGDLVTQAGQKYVAKGSIAAGAFNAADWIRLSDEYLPIVGGQLSGQLTVNPANGALRFNRAAQTWTIDQDIAGTVLQINAPGGSYRLDPVGASAPAAGTLMSRQKGDARYSLLDGSAPFVGNVTVQASFPRGINFRESGATPVVGRLEIGSDPAARVIINHPATGIFQSQLEIGADDITFSTNVGDGVIPTKSLTPGSIMFKSRADSRYMRAPIVIEVFDPGGQETVTFDVGVYATTYDIVVAVRNLSFDGTVVPEQEITLVQGLSAADSAAAIAIALNNVVASPITLQAVAVGTTVSITTTTDDLSDGTCEIFTPTSPEAAEVRGELQDEIVANRARRVGTLFFHAGSTPPVGAFVCNQAAVSRTAYAELFAEIGTTWGVGDGATTFNLPLLTDGRHVEGVVAGSVGTYYAQSIQSHAHTVDPPGQNFNTTSTGNHIHGTASGTGGFATMGVGGSLSGWDSGGNWNNNYQVFGTTGFAGEHIHQVFVDLAAFSSASAGGALTRPASAGFLPCIWYE